MDKKRVFSHRFSPDDLGHLYNSKYSWNLFWNESIKKSKTSPYILILDISDFYNQIYHHTLENQLNECGLLNGVVKWITSLLKSVTAGVSRGIPTGPHSVHLLAEIALNPIDNNLISNGIQFCRYADDFIIFCDSKIKAKITILQVAEILDSQQKLILQNQKTKILTGDEFQKNYSKMLKNRPINDSEMDIINIINKYSEDNSYQIIHLDNISQEDLEKFNEMRINVILDEYLSRDKPDYVRLKWFIRRLSQIGHPCGIKYCISHFDQLIPVVSEICQYFVSVSNFSNTVEWPTVGDKLVQLLENEIIKSNRYFQMSIYSLFNRKCELNHIDKLFKNYQNVSPLLQREIIITAYKNNKSDWIRGLKEHFFEMDSWTKRAFLIACSILPIDEKRFFIQQIDKYINNELDKLIVEWAKNKS